jgi:hypothetical protein
LTKASVTKPPPPRPWEKYRPKNPGPGQAALKWKLLQPGWAGNLDDDELDYILEHLKQDEKLRLWWGIPPRWQRISEEAIKRVAMEGSSDDLGHNRRLARPRWEPPAAA